MIKGISDHTLLTPLQTIKKIEAGWSGTFLINPEVAEFIIEKYNRGNRRIRKPHFKRYCRAMEDGLWRMNGETVVIEGAGTPSVKVGNGQHRLLAIIETGTTQEILLVQVPLQDIIATIDVGANRTTADNFKINGLTATTAQIGCIRTAYKMENDMYLFKKVDLIEDHHLIEFALSPFSKKETFLDIIKEAAACSRHKILSKMGLHGSTIIFFAYFLKANEYEWEDIKNFFRALAEGTDINGIPYVKHPFHHIRKSIPTIENKALDKMKKENLFQITDVRKRTITFNFLLEAWSCVIAKKKPIFSYEYNDTLEDEVELFDPILNWHLAKKARR
jgi:hypothetical protein